MNVRIPTNVAYFTVLVPAQTAGGKPQYREEAERIVTAYLYNEAVVVAMGYDDDLEKHEVLVRVESYQTESRFRSGLQDQRDRFASGLYRTTEPVVLTQSDKEPQS